MRDPRAGAPGVRVGAVHALAIASTLLLIAGATGWASAASANFTDAPSTGSPGMLVLSSDPWPMEFTDLRPGHVTHWQIAARLEDADRGTLSLEFMKEGELVAHPGGLTLRIDRCSVPWTLDPTPECAVGHRAVAYSRPADAPGISPTFALEDLGASDPTYLLVELGLEASAEAASDPSLMGLRAEIGVGLTAAGVSGAAPPNPVDDLPDTGGSPAVLLSLLVMGAGALGVGVSLRLASRQRRLAPSSGDPGRRGS